MSLVNWMKTKTLESCKTIYLNEAGTNIMFLGEGFHPVKRTCQISDDIANEIRKIHLFEILKAANFETKTILN